MRSISEKQGTAKNQAAKHNSIHILNPLDTQIGKVQFHGQTDRDDLQPKPQLSHSSWPCPDLSEELVKLLLTQTMKKVAAKVTLSVKEEEASGKNV